MITQDDLKIGDIILFKTGSIVKFFQKKAGFSKEASEYTHIAGSLGGFRLIEARDFLHKSGATNLDYFIKKKVPFIVLRYFNVEDKNRYKLGINWALYANLKYRLIELVGIWTNRFIKTSFNLFGRKNGVFCSELICNGLLDTGVKLFQKSANLIYPADFFDLYKSGYLKKIHP